MRAILTIASLVAGLAACDSPTAPALNPQPLPPGMHLATSALNPQPLPPGLHFSPTTTPRGGQATIYACATLRLYEPPDPCLR